MIASLTQEKCLKKPAIFSLLRLIHHLQPGFPPPVAIRTSIGFPSPLALNKAYLAHLAHMFMSGTIKVIGGFLPSDPDQGLDPPRNEPFVTRAIQALEAAYCPALSDSSGADDDMGSPVELIPGPSLSVTSCGDLGAPGQLDMPVAHVEAENSSAASRPSPSALQAHVDSQVDGTPPDGTALLQLTSHCKRTKGAQLEEPVQTITVWHPHCCPAEFHFPADSSFLRVKQLLEPVFQLLIWKAWR